jgi:Rad3-related DNA helicase
MLISNKKDEILDFLKQPGAIILSPSIEAGYDFKDDLARWQIIAKVPYSFLGSAWVKLNMDRSNKWYARKAIVRIVQASGRAVRGITDHATTYILDSNFKRLYTSNQELFPDWYKDAVHMK